MWFFKYFFKKREGNKALINWHHYVICHELMLVFSGLTKRLIINIPAGYTKTELVVINFIMFCLAHNPMSKFIYTSYRQRGIGYEKKYFNKVDIGKNS